MTTFTAKAAGLALVLAGVGTPAAIALQSPDAPPVSAPVESTAESDRAGLVGDAFVRTELFFGTDKPGPDVTDRQFRQFVNDEVTPRFPDGLTVLSGQGQFRDATGETIREGAKLLVLLYPVDSAPSSSAAIEEIRDAYEDQFQQQSVLRADSRDRVSF